MQWTLDKQTDKQINVGGLQVTMTKGKGVYKATEMNYTELKYVTVPKQFRVQFISVTLYTP